jgi:hypothetical protein
MKSTNPSVFEAATHPGKKSRSAWLTWLFEALSRGETPVDGCGIPDVKAMHRKNPEPVRWGNFR